MIPWPEQLYRLLPAVHQIRDGDRGEPLRQFLAVIGEQVQSIDDDIGQLYDNWFIETCQDWVVPYLADLVGFRRVADAGHPSDAIGPRAQGLNRALYPRREIANLVRRRRRKGTLTVLEDLARDVTGWRARAVESGRLVSFFQQMQHPQADLGRTVNTHCPQDLVRLNTPFDRIAHTIDVKTIAPVPGHGWYAPNKVGLFVWRRRVYSATRVTPCRVCAKHGPHVQAYTFHRLGLRQPLYVNPVSETDELGQATEHHVPTPLYRHLLCSPSGPGASDEFYGTRTPGKPQSVAVFVKWKHSADFQLVERGHVHVVDLSDENTWAAVQCQLGCEEVALDPETGLLLFHADAVSAVEVTYHYAFSRDMGGGEYPRRLAPRTDRQTVRVQQGPSGRHVETVRLFCAIEGASRKSGAPCGAQSPVFQRVPKANQAAECTKLSWHVTDDLCVEIIDSDTYEIEHDETLIIADGKTLELRATSGSWPLVRVRSDAHLCGSPWHVQLGKGSRLILDGLLVCGATVQVEGIPPKSLESPQPPQHSGPPCPAGNPCSCGPEAANDEESVRPAALIVRHATFVPGGRTTAGCLCQPNHASITMRLTDARLVITDSIVGTLNIEHPACGCHAQHETPVCPAEPIELLVTDSILDAAYGRPALTGNCCFPAHVDATLERTTVLGDLCVQQISRAEDSLLAGLIHVQRRGHGYMRFCYVPREMRELPALDDGETFSRCAAFLQCLADYGRRLAIQAQPPPSEVNCCTSIRTPPRFKCVPETYAPFAGTACGPGCGTDLPLSGTGTGARLLVPRFVSTRYGEPGYGELALDCPREIVRGAEDESELGALHDLYRPQYGAALAARLQEYSPVDFEAAVIYADDLRGGSFPGGSTLPCCSE